VSQANYNDLWHVQKPERLKAPKERRAHNKGVTNGRHLAKRRRKEEYREKRDPDGSFREHHNSADKRSNIGRLLTRTEKRKRPKDLRQNTKRNGTREKKKKKIMLDQEIILSVRNRVGGDIDHKPFKGEKGLKNERLRTQKKKKKKREVGPWRTSAKRGNGEEGDLT